MDTNHVKIGTVVSKHGYKGSIKLNLLSSNLKGNLDVTKIPKDKIYEGKVAKIMDFATRIMPGDDLEAEL